MLFQGVNKVCQYLFQGVNKVCQYSSVNSSLHLTLRTWSKSFEDWEAKINVSIVICVRSSWVSPPSREYPILIVNISG